MGINMRHVFVVFAVITGSCFAANLTCLRCDATAFPAACGTIQHCGEHELCSTEARLSTVGSMEYTLGCKDRAFCSSSQRRAQSNTCSECCSTDLCNSASCGKNGFSSGFGPVCYTCDSQIGAHSCNRVTQCGRDEVCSIEHISLHIVGAPKDLFRTQCQHKDVCQSSILQVIGRKRATCGHCCDTNLCNAYDPTDPNCDSSSGSTASTGSTTGSTGIVFTPAPVTTTATATTTNSVTSQASTTVMTTSTMPPTTTQPTTTPPVTTTRPATVPATTQQPCEDTPLCTISGTSFCHLGTDFIHQNCRKKCGFCDSGVSTTIAHTSGAFCKDAAVGCSSSLHCQDPAYRDWALINCQKTCGVCTEHLSTSTGSDWLLLLKAVSGAPGPDLYELWSSNRTLNTLQQDAGDLTATFLGHYKTSYSNEWDIYKFDMVRVALYTGGHEVAQITFRTVGMSKDSDWFRADHVIDSTWGDISQSQFQMSPDTSLGLEFHARYNASSSNGCNDFGWFTITTTTHCFRYAQVPAFYYTPSSTLPYQWSQRHPQQAEVFVILGHSNYKPAHTG